MLNLLRSVYSIHGISYVFKVGSVGCLVILGKPLQILVLHPRHPGFVLLVVVFLHPLRARLTVA